MYMAAHEFVHILPHHQYFTPDRIHYTHANEPFDHLAGMMVGKHPLHLTYQLLVVNRQCHRTSLFNLFPMPSPHKGRTGR